jgi:DNA-binding transcriptional ArsR family regulator
MPATVDLARPHNVLGAGPDGEALVILARTLEPLTGRQVAARAALPQRTISTALDRLVRQGLVLRERVPPAHLHRLNRDHIAANIVEELAALRIELLRRLRALVRSWDVPALHVSLDADGEAIVLHVVRRAEVAEGDLAWRGQLALLEASAHAWTGNGVQVEEIAAGSVAERVPELERAVPLGGSLR